MPSFSALSVSVTMFQAAVTRKPGRPEDGAEVGPDAGILVGEHHHLQAVVRHVPGHGGVGGHHVAAELLVLAFDGEIAVRVPGPLVEGRRRVLAQPSYEELGDFMVVDRVRIRRIGDENICTAISILVAEATFRSARVVSNRRLR